MSIVLLVLTTLLGVSRPSEPIYSVAWLDERGSTPLITRALPTSPIGFVQIESCSYYSFLPKSRQSPASRIANLRMLRWCHTQKSHRWRTWEHGNSDLRQHTYWLHSKRFQLRWR